MLSVIQQYCEIVAVDLALITSPPPGAMTRFLAYPRRSPMLSRLGTGTQLAFSRNSLR